MSKNKEISNYFFRDHKLAPYSTFQIGGEADYFFEAKNNDDAVAAIKWANESKTPIFVFGAGSNLLFDDEGFRGLVLKISAANLQINGEQITADAGTKMAAVVKAAADTGLTGIEAWHGMPGTVGGAVFGNAGCFGVEVADVLKKALVFLPGQSGGGGRTEEVGVEFFDYDYRSSNLKNGEDGVILQATFQLRKSDPTEIKNAMKEIAKKRMGKQPAGASTGSFFKNPPDHAAGWLIEQCGLKGKQIGGAKISEQHANFFVNVGGATSVDVLALADLAKAEVKKKFGIELEREVIFVLAS